MVELCLFSVCYDLKKSSKYFVKLSLPIQSIKRKRFQKFLQRHKSLQKKTGNCHKKLTRYCLLSSCSSLSLSTKSLMSSIKYNVRKSMSK